MVGKRFLPSLSVEKGRNKNESFGVGLEWKGKKCDLWLEI